MDSPIPRNLSYSGLTRPTSAATSRGVGVHEPRSLGGRQADHPFDSILTKQRAGIGAKPPNDQESKEARIRHATQQLVASALVKPLLQQARDTPLDSNLIDGGQGEKAFGKKLDTILADRIVKGSNFPLVQSINERLSQRYAQSEQPRPGVGRQLEVSG